MRLTRTQRFRWYVILLGVSTLFFGLALQFIPLAVIKPTKFAKSGFCIGTICSVAAKFMLNGPRTQLRLMVEWRKLPYSLALVASTLLNVICLLRARQLLVGRGRVGVASLCIARTTRLATRRAASPA